MNWRFYSLCIISVCTLCPSVLAERVLSPKEVTALLETLTKDSFETWIPYGEVSGTLTEESWPANKYSDAEVDGAIDTHVNASAPTHLVAQELIAERRKSLPYNVRYAHRASERKVLHIVSRYHKDRFYSESNVRQFQDLLDLRDDTAIPYHLTKEDEAFFQKTLVPQWGHARFKPHLNQHRVVGWDGREYVRYNVSPGTSGRKAAINRAKRDAAYYPQQVGPMALTAGIVPWGHGVFTLEHLLECQVRVVESENERQLTANISYDNLELVVELERRLAPNGEIAFAPVSYLIIKNGLVSQQAAHSGHQWVSRRWVPTEIVIEKESHLYGAVRKERRTFQVRYNVQRPEPTHLAVDISWGAHVTYRTAQFGEFTYRTSPLLNTETLLAHRLALEHQLRYSMTERRSVKHNCATTSLNYACTKLDIQLPANRLATLVDASGNTRFADMLHLLQQNEVNAKAVRATLNELAFLGPGYQVVLHVEPDKRGHYVLLGGIDSDSVHIIDFTGRRLTYSVSHRRFLQGYWKDGGPALVITPSNMQHDRRVAQMQPLDITALSTYRGALGMACTDLSQGNMQIPCPSNCDGYNYEYPTRFQCEWAASGLCDPDNQLHYRERSGCLEDTENPGECISDQIWTFHDEKAACM